MKNIYSAEKSAEFRSLMQIEALRSTASILANSMFFYLSRSGDKFINTIGIKYERNKINKLMPMAMKGAVGGVTYIENEISKSLSSRIIYDYRHVDNREKISAELLEIKNHQIMFDFICAKSEIVDRHNGKVLDISLLRKQNWTIHTDLEANIITVKKDKYEFKLQSINNEYQIIKIKTFPAKIIQELLEKEYGMQLPEYIKNSKFEVEVDLIASRELRNLNIKILELESSKQLGKITFEDQEITDIRKEYNTLNLYLYEVTSTDKNKKNTNASNYPIFKEKLNNLAIKLAPANTVQNLVKEVDSIRKRVARKSIKNSNSNLLLDKIDSFKKQLLNINSNTNLKVSIAEWETLKQEEKENIRSTGSKRRLPDNPSGQNPNKKSKTSNNTDKHLKRNEKEDLSKSNNEKNYNLSKAIKNINLDNPVLLTSIKNINRESIIESNIVMKAFDAVPNINSKALETHVKLDILLEDNHLTNHRDNISTIVKKIDSGEIDSDCIILLERKQYGNNLGIQDVIKLANILKYNEKNPNQNIKLPKEINNDSLIYQDAIMYKAASEKNIKVIGLEGKDLEAQKNSPNYNENREHYMANVIYQLNRRGYSVIAMTGSTHKDNVRAELEKLQSQNKGITRLSKISRNIQSAPTPSNNKATIYANKLGQALERHISKKHLTPPTEKNISNTKKYKTSLLSK